MCPSPSPSLGRACALDRFFYLVAAASAAWAGPFAIDCSQLVRIDVHRRRSHSTSHHAGGSSVCGRRQHAHRFATLRCGAHLCRWRSWTLAGYERVTSGALQQEYLLRQSWVATPAPLEDLRRAENEWALAKLLAEVKSRDEPGPA